MVIGILTLLCGCFVIYQAYNLLLLQSFVSGLSSIAGAYVICGAGMICTGALSIANESRKNLDYEFRSGCISLVVSLVCFTHFYGDLQIWAGVNIGAAVAHFIIWNKMKKEKTASEASNKEPDKPIRVTASEPQHETTSSGVLKKMLFIIGIIVLLFAAVLLMPSK